MSICPLSLLRLKMRLTQLCNYILNMIPQRGAYSASCASQRLKKAAQDWLSDPANRVWMVGLLQTAKATERLEPSFKADVG